MEPGGQGKGLNARLLAALRLPRRPGSLRALLLEAAWLVPLLLLLGWAGGLAAWEPRFDSELAKLAMIALVAPALGEELLFRAALLPPPSAGPLPIRRVAIATALFVAWHPLQLLVHGPRWAALMLDPWFIAAVAASGVALARLYWRTGSIWPPVALHWLIVVGWKALLGGPSPWGGE